MTVMTISTSNTPPVAADVVVTGFELVVVGGCVGFVSKVVVVWVEVVTGFGLAVVGGSSGTILGKGKLCVILST